MNIPRPRPVLKTVVPPPHKLKTEQKIDLTKMNGHVKLKEHRLEQKEPSPSLIAYVGDSQMPITSELKIVTPGDDTPSGIWPVFRMMVRSQKIS